jgi:hypothetical protein
VTILRITIAHRLVFSVTVFCRCLVAASNGGRSPSFVFPNCPRPQLAASNNNSSKRRNPSGYPTNCNSKSKSKSSYFTTGGLSPISSSWRQVPRGSRPDFFFQLNPCGHSLYVTSSLTRRWVRLLRICFTFCQVYVSHLH